ncbi:MAG: dNTP triphosphohydrolase [Planctomycetes bacterium]|nr:dNTP triphosphohydrolase [Planctomycetota bacterium]
MCDGLRSCAATEAVSQGRVFPEPPHPYRSDFERDRDRIVHSSAFRRLEGKTQVFSPGINDYYRSRLTHTIEVAQIGRTIAKVLGLNESLTEAICLAHDLGHPPFGHTGEQTLDELMAGHGGFEHNTQTLRIVTLLEHPYPAFMGLNLMYETRLGLARKCVAAVERRSRGLPLAECGFRTADLPTGVHHQSSINNHQFFAATNCTLEGQIADVADRIAYNCHDLEDGMRARLIDGNQMRHLDLYTEAAHRVGVERIPDWTIRRTRVAKTITDRLVSDCIDHSRQNIEKSGVTTAAGVCRRAEDLIALSPQYDQRLTELSRFLLDHLYHHETLVAAATKARGWLTELFAQLCREPGRMPSYFRGFIPDYGLERAVCDYVAGMTDRYCLKFLGVAGP